MGQIAGIFLILIGAVCIHIAASDQGSLTSIAAIWTRFTQLLQQGH